MSSALRKLISLTQRLERKKITKRVGTWRTAHLCNYHICAGSLSYLAQTCRKPQRNSRKDQNQCVSPVTRAFLLPLVVFAKICPARTTRTLGRSAEGRLGSFPRPLAVVTGGGEAAVTANAAKQMRLQVTGASFESYSVRIQPRLTENVSSWRRETWMNLRVQRLNLT